MENDDLRARLANIKQIFTVDSLLGRKADDPAMIAKYYRRNRLAYRLFNSRKGFVHMGISRNGVFKHADFYEQAKTVKEYIEKVTAARVLELAPGKAATTEFLASIKPETQFFGIDLPNGQLDIRRANGKSNLFLVTGDFHDLSRYESESMDIVYVIEALCHAKDRKKVLAEVRRVLKPGGYFIVFDGYYKKSEAELTNDEKLAAYLLFKSMMVDEGNHHYFGFLQDLDDNQMTVVEEEDLSRAIMPSLYRLEAKARLYVDHPKLARVMRRVLPDEFLGNAVAGYLFPATVEAGIFAYYLTVSQKEK